MRSRLAPSLLMAGAALLFALMSAVVKLASPLYGAGELVMYRSLVGLLLMVWLLRLRGIDWRTPVPAMHLVRSITGTVSMYLWFQALAALPLATATTLNIMSSVWIALFLLAAPRWRSWRGAVPPPHAGQSPLDARLVLAVGAGFVGVALVLQPTIEAQQFAGGVFGLASGLLAATAYLQVTSLGRVGEPGERVVLYFSASGVVLGLVLSAFTGGLHAHTPRGALLLLVIGCLATAAQWMLTRAYSTGATLGVASLQYLGVVFAFGIGVLAFGDPVTGAALAGMVLIVGAGVAATFLRPSIRRPAEPLRGTD
ncbi:MAG: DMT family transporter [Rubrivivax sp.]